MADIKRSSFFAVVLAAVLGAVVVVTIANFVAIIASPTDAPAIAANPQVVTLAAGPSTPDEPLCDNPEALRIATMRVLSEHGFDFSSSNQQTTRRLQSWVDTLPVGCVRTEYDGWLKYAADSRTRDARRRQAEDEAMALQSRLPMPNE